mmetsp:Transcript_4942/g.17900  ORF Transcript_4942/g.17900 Transcript_4942/m.17900 type:complete len:102 (-) Transcript_4942:85-390(-)
MAGGRNCYKQSKKLAKDYADGSIALESIDESSMKQHLYTPDIPDPDLMIRTSGEQRISNFMLWQAAYSELYFSPLPWPEFDEWALIGALDDYLSRTRRFGH